MESQTPYFYYSQLKKKHSKTEYYAPTQTGLLLYDKYVCHTKTIEAKGELGFKLYVHCPLCGSENVTTNAPRSEFDVEEIWWYKCLDVAKRQHLVNGKPIVTHPKQFFNNYIFSSDARIMCQTDKAADEASDVMPTEYVLDSPLHSKKPSGDLERLVPFEDIEKRKWLLWKDQPRSKSGTVYGVNLKTLYLIIKRDVDIDAFIQALGKLKVGK